jgi:hypothetical protein
VDEGRFHRERRLTILREQPEVKLLFSPNPRTAWFAAAVVSGQFALAAALTGQSWWVILIAAYLIGAFATDYLNAVMRECSHNLVLRTTPLNKAFSFFRSLSICARCCHLRWAFATIIFSTTVSWANVARHRCGDGGDLGTRIWPESCESLPKQFVPLIGDRATLQSIVDVVSDRKIFEPAVVITNFDYRFRVAEQLKEIGAEATILLEPETAGWPPRSKRRSSGCGRKSAARPRRRIHATTSSCSWTTHRRGQNLVCGSQ